MAFLGKMKQSVESLSDKTKKRLAMEGLLKQARISLEDYFSPKIVKPEERFSRDLFRNAQGIVLISEGKGGLVFAGKAGTGVVLCRLDKQDEWSGPLAIKTGGISWGFQGGIAKCDHIILLPTSQHVHTFMAKGSIQIQGNAQAAVGKIGRDASMGVGASEKAIVPVLSYSFKSEGLYGGVSLEGAIITVRHSCNDDYYGCKNTPIENIIKGTIKVPKPNADYNRIVSLLNEYCNTSHPLQFPRADAGSRQSDIKNGIFDNTDQKNTEIDQGEERRGQLSQNAGISGAEIHVAEIVPPLDSDYRLDNNQSRLDNNQSRLDNTQPRLDNTQPRLDNTQPRLDNTQPRLDNTQPRLDNIQPPLDSDPRLYNNQSPLDTKVGPSAPLLQQQPIPFYHAPKNQRTHPPPP